MSELTTKTPVLDLLASMTADSIEASSLDAETLMLVRIAALAAVDSPPISYALNLQAASDLDIDPDQVRGVLAAIAPIVGTARIASATVNILEALEIAHRGRGSRRGTQELASTFAQPLPSRTGWAGGTYRGKPSPFVAAASSRSSIRGQRGRNC